MNARKRLAVLVFAVGILIPGSALAQGDGGRAKPGVPISPPGHEIGEADRPEQANEPTTGPINRFERGSPPQN